MKVEQKIKKFIDSLSPEQIEMAKSIMFSFSNRDLINRIKKIYEQPGTDTNTSNIVTDTPK